MGMLVTVAARSDQDDWNIRTARAMKILLAAVLAFVLAPVLARAEGWQTSSPEAQGMSSRELAGLVEFGIANGMDSVLVVRHGSIVAEAYYAPFAPGMKHRINSATKSVIGSLVSIALKDGLLKNVDQPVLGFFPERSFANMDERKKALRLRHLLDMTSGLEWDEPLSAASFESLLQMERSPDWVQFILDHPMVREPGAAFEYNSGNPHVLSAILSKVTGRSALDYARQKLFGPLGIEDVFWRHDPQGVSAGGAGLYLQPRDMARLGQLWLADGVWKGERLLAPGWIDSARHASLEMGLGPLLRYANLFWSLPAKGVYLAVGYDRQLIAVMPELNVVAVFTGGRRVSTATGIPSTPKYPLSAVLDRLKAAVKSDGALPEDPAALALLADKTKEVAQEVRTQSAPASPLAAAISGKVYRLQPNPARFSSFSLTFENGEASYAYEVDGQRFGGPVGLNGLYRIGGHRLYGPSAAKGVWRDDKTFELEVQTPGNDDVGVATMTFDGTSVSARMAALGTWIELKGEAD
jgi:CubicO group peptidase (beta-lactamase class C family)